MENESIPRFGTVNFEKRRHPRVSVDLPLEYWRIDTVKSQSGRIADISEGGLLFYISEEIEVGQHLRVRLFLDSCLKLKAIEALVEVVWKDFRFEKEGNYRIGVKFVEISSEAMEKLRNYLITLTNSKAPSDFKLPSRLLSTLGISILAESAYVIPKSSTED
jgi:c-di-GMP-binding flagellar brake protein YcgR